MRPNSIRNPLKLNTKEHLTRNATSLAYINVGVKSSSFRLTKLLLEHRCGPKILSWKEWLQMNAITSVILFPPPPTT